MSKKVLIGLVIVVLVVVAAVLSTLMKKPALLPPEVVPSEVVPSEVVPPEKVKKVFFAHSYDPEDVCGQPQDEGAVAMFEKLGYKEGVNLKIYRFYMDTKRTYTTPEQMKMRGEMAREEIKKVDPDVIMVFDDDAAREVMLPLLDTKYPIVFSGMNAPIEVYDEKVDLMETREHPGHNVTGVLELLRIAESVKLFQEFLPLKKFLFISDTAPVGKAIRAGFLTELESYRGKFPAEVEMYEVGLFEDYQKIILEANEKKDIDAIFPICVSLGTKDGRRVSPKEIVAWTLKNSLKPDIAPTFFFAQFGYLGGVTIDFPTLGGQAAVKAVRILRGENPGEIPIEEAARYTFTIAINLARADQLGIEIPLEILGMAGQVYKTMNLYPEYEMREE